MIFEYESILPSFPPVCFAFAYGSGAIKQGTYDYDLRNKFAFRFLKRLFFIAFFI